jgi:hypothetical protein
MNLVRQKRMEFDALKVVFKYPNIMDKFMEKWVIEGIYDFKYFGAPIRYESGIRSLPAKIRNPDAIAITIDPVHFTKEEIMSYLDDRFKNIFYMHNGRKMPRARLAADYARRNAVWRLFDMGKTASEIAHETGEDPDWVAKALQRRTLKLKRPRKSSK